MNSTIIVIAGRDGFIAHMNPAFEKITGCSKNDLTGRQMREHIFGELSDERHEELLGVILSGKTWHGTVKNRRPQQLDVSPKSGWSGEMNSRFSCPR